MKQFKVITVLATIIISMIIVFKIPIQLGLDLQGGMQLTLEAQDTEKVKVDADSIIGAMQVIQTRINGLGLTEPVIRRKGLKQIVVELPGIKNPERAINLIGQTALLEFIPAEWAPPGIENLSEEKLAVLAGPNANIQTYEEKDTAGNVVKESPIILKETALTGADLKMASPGTNELGEPIVNIAFNSEGAKKFYQATAKNVGKPIAIVLDGTIISAPNVQEAISGGRAQISGQFNIQEMRDLVIKLKAGALPVPIEIISNKIVGPTLGQDSIQKSKIACLIGFVLVCLFMMFIYRLPGALASIALICYALFVFAIFKLFNATLTLPGIAGFILTIGMAVDANVIIFERIKEEFHQSKNIKKAISSGFDRAFVTILDANITTLIAATVLFWLGTGTIKGFAVTLSIGILVSMYTAIALTKLLLHNIVSDTNKDKLIKGLS